MVVELVARRTRDAKVFDLENGQRQAVFSPFTHYQDDQGAWQEVDLNFRLDGLDQLVDRHLIAFRADASGLSVFHKPTGRGIRFNFPRRPDRVSGRTAEWDLADGTTWRLTVRKTGLKTEATVIAKRGPRTYTFSGTMLGGLAPPNADGNGNLVQPAGHFSIQRPEVHGADGKVYQTSGWSRTGGNISFDFDDTALPDEALPYVIDPTSTFNVAASGDDGFAFTTGSTYPPTDSPGVATSDGEDGADRSLAGIYNNYVGLIRWDTASIPDDATIDSATLRLRVTAKSNVDSRSLVAEWYEAGTIGTEDHTNTAASDAHSGTGIGSITTGADNDFALGNLNNVNKTGYTGLRIHISGGQPTGFNYVYWASFDHATLTEPRLIVVYTEAGGVIPGTLALVLATFIPIVAAPRVVLPGTLALTLTRFAPSTVLGTRITPATAALTLTTFAPTVTASANVSVTPAPAVLVLTTFAPDVMVAGVSEGLVIGDPTSFVGEGKIGAPATPIGDVTVTPSPAALTLTGFAPTVSTPRLVTPSTAALTTATFAPVVSTPRVVVPATLGLTLTALAPVVLAPRLVTPGVASLTLTAFAPLVSVGKRVTPTTAALSLTAFAPTVVLPRVVTPATAALSLTSFAPTVGTFISVTPLTASLTTTAFAPTVLAPRTVVPSTLALALTRFAPSVLTPRVVRPATGTLTTTAFAPTIVTPRTVTPGVQALTLTRFAPTVTVGTPKVIVPATATLTTTSFAPVVSTPRTVTPATLALLLLGFAPTVSVPRTVTPAALALTLTLFAPSVAVAAAFAVFIHALGLDQERITAGGLDRERVGAKGYDAPIIALRGSS